MTTINEKTAFFDGFFYFFGFIENPAKEKSYEIVQARASEKIRRDIKRVNSSYRRKIQELQADLNG